MKIHPAPLPISCIRRALTAKPGKIVIRPKIELRMFTNPGISPFGPANSQPNKARTTYTNNSNRAKYQNSDLEARPEKVTNLENTLETD